MFQCSLKFKRPTGHNREIEHPRYACVTDKKHDFLPFFPVIVSRMFAKVRLVKQACARSPGKAECKSCTPFWRKAHLQVKIVKHGGFQRSFGNSNDALKSYQNPNPNRNPLKSTPQKKSIRIQIKINSEFKIKTQTQSNQNFNQLFLLSGALTKHSARVPRKSGKQKGCNEVIKSSQQTA